MSVLKGDFIGFTFGGVHSSTLGLIRVSDGSRYTDNLLPSFQDITNEITGRNETNFFGSYYTKKDLSVKVAFDAVTEDQLRGIRQLFGDHSIKDLIFDETPYKVYRAKTGQNVSLSHVCFDEGGKRVYKGDGTISFSCFFPFARSRYKFLDEYTNDLGGSIKVPEWVEDSLAESSDPVIAEYALTYYKNLDEWKDSSGMAATQNLYDYIGTGRDNILLLNPGDVETDCIITVRGTPSVVGSVTKYLYNIKIALSSDSQYRIVINNTSNRNSDQEDPDYEDPLDTNELIEDEYLQINTRNNLIEGVSKVDNTYIKTGRIYNQYMTAGVFFKIPVIKITSTDQLIITDSGGTTTNIKGYIDNLKYDYLYY